jgi:hypothetical protein
MVRRKPSSEVEFDLEHVRHVKRLVKRALKQLVLMEKWLRKARDLRATDAEIAEAFEAHGDKERASQVRARAKRRS